MFFHDSGNKSNFWNIFDRGSNWDMIRLVTKLCYQEAAIRGDSVKYAIKYSCSKYALYLSAYRSNGGQVTFKNFKYRWFIWGGSSVVHRSRLPNWIWPIVRTKYVAYLYVTEDIQYVYSILDESIIWSLSRTFVTVPGQESRSGGAVPPKLIK